MMFWGHHMGYGGWGLLLGAAIWIGLIILGVWLLARLFPGVGGGSRQRGPDSRRRAARSAANTAPSTALQILQRRYARGEITKEEYETIRHDLAS